MDRLLAFAGDNLMLSLALLGLTLALIYTEISRLFSGFKAVNPAGLTALINREDALLVDVSPIGDFEKGHIAGARNIVYTEMIDPSNFFKPSEQLQSYFTPVAGKDKELVAYCFIGQTASVVYVAGRILGYPMKLYDGSMQEWSRIKELPMETTPKQ